jgi:hypothetical protein
MSTLTLGIPTHDRPKLLPRALRAALSQTRPVQIIVADDLALPETREVLESEEFRGHDIRHILTCAGSCWGNWKAAAQACETEYFAWLQDDDVVRDTYAERIVDVLDYFPDVYLWMARLQCGFSEELGCWYHGNGPWVPMDFLTGRPARWPGAEILTVSSYLTSWSLAPAFAFRTGPAFTAALNDMPDDCDIFIERLMPACMGLQGPFVADPIVAGYWISHSEQLHIKLAPEAPAQAARAFACLDNLMDRLEERECDWRAILLRWMGWISKGQLCNWLDNLKKLPDEIDRGRYLERVTGVAEEYINLAIVFPPATPTSTPTNEG